MSKRGLPRNPLELAVLARTYDQEAHAPFMTVGMQRVLLAPLVFTARHPRRGRRGRGVRGAGRGRWLVSAYARRLPDFRLEVYLGEWEFAARHHLTASDAETLTIAELLARRRARGVRRLPLGYAPTWGTERAARGDRGDVRDRRRRRRARVRRRRGGDLLADAGAGRPGRPRRRDRAELPVDRDLPLAAGADVTGLPLRPEDGWALDLDALEALLRPETRLIAVNFPNNPTGALPDPETGRARRAVRRARDPAGLRRGLPRPRARRHAALPQAADLSATALSLSVMSKAYGLPGLRIGWLACRDRAVLGGWRRASTTRRSATPDRASCSPRSRCGAARDPARNRAIVARNLPVFDAFFAAHADSSSGRARRRLRRLPPLPRLEGVEAFCRELVEQAGVLLLPA